MERENINESDILTRLLCKLNAPNVNPNEREKLQEQIEQIMNMEFEELI